MPANRLRVAVDWLTDLVTRRQIVQFGLVQAQEVSLADVDRPPRNRVPPKVESLRHG